MKFQVYATKGNTPASHIRVGGTIGGGIANNTGYFPDGSSIAAAVQSATNTASGKLTAYDETNSDLDRDALNITIVTLDLQIDTAVLYVQGKVNAAPDFANATAIATAAGMKLKKHPEKLPIPEQVVDADAVFSNIPETVLIQIKKYPKYSKYFEIWATTNPNDEQSWKLWDTVLGRQLLVKGLSTGQKYYFRIVACNGTGKAIPSNPLDQMAA